MCVGVSVWGGVRMSVSMWYVEYVHAATVM